MTFSSWSWIYQKALPVSRECAKIFGTMNWKRAWKKRLRKIKAGKYLNNLTSGRLTRAKVLSYLTMAAFVAVIGGVLVMGVLFAWYAKDLPHPDKVVRREGFSTKIYDRNEKLLYDVFADQRRIPVKLKEIPEHLKQATVAIEDKNFYKHEGFDPFGMFRGFLRLFTRGRAQGGSTLTQQLVKNVLLTQKRAISRKIKEFILASGFFWAVQIFLLQKNTEFSWDFV